jgi:hypothetical protein
MGTALERIIEKQPNLSIDGLISGNVNINAPGSTAIGNIINAEEFPIDPEVKRLLIAALSLSSPLDIKKLLQDFISQKIKES